MGNILDSLPDSQDRHFDEITHVELILMGTGDTGKTTILKQLQILYEKKYEDVELLLQTIYKNIGYSIQVLIKEAKKTEEYFQEGNESVAENLMKISFEEEGILNEEIGEKITKIWKDPLIQKVYKNRTKFQEQLIDQIE